MEWSSTDNTLYQSAMIVSVLGRWFGVLDCYCTMKWSFMVMGIYPERSNSTYFLGLLDLLIRGGVEKSF